MTNQIKNRIEELKRNIPKVDVFREDTSIIASDYHNWKDVYKAIDDAFELGKAEGVSLTLKDVDKIVNEVVQDYALWKSGREMAMEILEELKQRLKEIT